MTRACWAGVVALSLAAATPDTSPQTPPRDQAAALARGTSSLSGQVRLGPEGQAVPVRRARVTLESESGERRVADSDTDGRYRFDALPAGRYRVTAEKAGFVPVGAGTPDEAEAEWRSIGAGEAAAAHIALERAAACSGRVTSDSGEPAVGVIVSVVRFVFTPAGRRPSVVTQARTDDLGRFRVHTLPAGEYYLSASPDPRQSFSEPRAPDERATGFARTYFPGTPRTDEARTIALDPGQDARDLDFTLTRVPLAVVSGRVVDSMGKPVTAYGLRVQPVGGPPGDLAGLIDPRTSEFTFSSVPPGEFWLLAAATPAPGGEPEFAAERMTVAGTDLKNLTVRLVRGASIAGRVEVEGGAAALPARIGVQAYDAAYDLPLLPGKPRAPAAVAANGSFAMAGVFGPRLVRLENLPAGWAVKSIVLDQIDITDGPFDFTTTDRARTLRIVVTSTTASVRGEVVSSGGRPSRARVVVFARDARWWGPRSRFVKSVRTSADGHYAIEGLLPGEYAVAVVGPLADGMWEDPAVLRQIAGSATPVSVAAGQTVQMPLRRQDRP
jgi:hypothetical protein